MWASWERELEEWMKNSWKIKYSSVDGCMPSIAYVSKHLNHSAINKNKLHWLQEVIYEFSNQNTILDSNAVAIRWVCACTDASHTEIATRPCGHSQCVCNACEYLLFIKYWTSYWAQFLFIFELLNNRCMYSLVSRTRLSTMHKTHFGWRNNSLNCIRKYHKLLRDRDESDLDL